MFMIDMQGTRDFATASLRYRFRGNVNFACISPNALLGATSQGAVYTLPPRINWLLLILCQTILALPIVLVWLTLRSRRKRQHGRGQLHRH